MNVRVHEDPQIFRGLHFLNVLHPLQSVHQDTEPCTTPEGTSLCEHVGDTIHDWSVCERVNGTNDMKHLQKLRRALERQVHIGDTARLQRPRTSSVESAGSVEYQYGCGRNLQKTKGLQALAYTFTSEGGCNTHEDQ